jgi:hypothetical protein
MGLAIQATKDYSQALYHLNRANAIYEGQPVENRKEFEEEMMDCKLNMAGTHHSLGVDFQ